MQTVNIKKFLKTKIRSYGDEATYFHTRKLPETGSRYILFFLTLIYCVLKRDENYCLKEFLKECKYIKIQKKKGD